VETSAHEIKWLTVTVCISTLVAIAIDELQRSTWSTMEMDVVAQDGETITYSIGDTGLEVSRRLSDGFIDAAELTRCISTQSMAL